MLPRRWWPWLDDRVPASDSALPASIITLLAAAAVGIPGFLDYVAITSEASAAAALRIVEQNLQTRPDLDTADALRRMAMSLNALSIFMFLLMTPLGLVTAYLGLSGIIRTAGALFNDPHGDLALTVADHLVWRSRTWRVERVAVMHRTSLEGVEMPDRLISGAKAGITGCEMVLVCSRRKPGWDTGTVVLSDGGAYRVGKIEERTLGGWLRTLYPLYEHRDQEAFRRTVIYNLPTRS
jgi:hypothetical protein